MAAVHALAFDVSTPILGSAERHCGSRGRFRASCDRRTRLTVRCAAVGELPYFCGEGRHEPRRQRPLYGEIEVRCCLGLWFGKGTLNWLRGRGNMFGSEYIIFDQGTNEKRSRSKKVRPANFAGRRTASQNLRPRCCPLYGQQIAPMQQSLLSSGDTWDVREPDQRASARHDRPVSKPRACSSGAEGESRWSGEQRRARNGDFPEGAHDSRGERFAGVPLSNL